MKNCVSEKLIKPKSISGVLDIDMSEPLSEGRQDPACLHEVTEQNSGNGELFTVSSMVDSAISVSSSSEDSIDGGLIKAVKFENHKAVRRQSNHMVQIVPGMLRRDSAWVGMLKYENIEKENHKCIVWSAIGLGIVVFLVLAAVFVYFFIDFRNQLIS